jgi:hypothetical protein
LFSFTTSTSGRTGPPRLNDRRFREAIDGAYRALDELRRGGAIKAVGVGVNEVAPCVRFANEGSFDCFLLAGRYTLLEQNGLDDLLPLAERQGFSLLLGGPFNSGILATGPTPAAKYNYGPAPPEIIDRVKRIDARCRSLPLRSSFRLATRGWHRSSLARSPPPKWNATPTIWRCRSRKRFGMS